MRRSLSPHPDFPCSVLRGLSVEVERLERDELALSYDLEGVSDGLVFPRPTDGRTDELWKHTCLEAFVREPGVAGYRELNLAAGGWAAYRFDSYRQGMANADIGAPAIAVVTYEPLIGATFRGRWALDLSPELTWEVGLSAVIEAADGTFSYWALAHPPGRPDFHHPDCFALEVPAPQGS